MVYNLNISNPELINFIEENKDINIEYILVESLPILTYCLQKKDEGFDYAKNSISHLLAEIKKENAVQHERESNLQKLLLQQSDHLSSLITNKDNKSSEQLLLAISNVIQINSKELTNVIQANTTDTIQNQVIPTLNNISTNFSNSSKRGIYSENKLEAILNRVLPDVEVENTSKIPHSGDFIVNYRNLGKVIIENKNYTGNVTKGEVDKFISDCTSNDCYGILMSQHSSIQSKSHFHIDINNNKFLLYAHYVEYSEDIIRECFSIIQSLHNLGISSTISDKPITLSDSDLDDFLKEYKQFKDTNNKIIDNLSNQIKMLRSQNLPVLANMLSTKFPNNIRTFKCDLCSRTFQNQAGRSAHMKTCKVIHSSQTDSPK